VHAIAMLPYMTSDHNCDIIMDSVITSWVP
jgi:hypothetical protein